MLSKIIEEVVAYEGKIVDDLTKSDGTLGKFVEVLISNSLGFRY